MYSELCITAWAGYLYCIWAIYRAMHMPYYLDLYFILSLLSLQGICLTVSFPHLISLYFVIASLSTAALYRSWEKSMALVSVGCCGQVGRALHIQGVSGSNFDSETGHSDRSSVIFLSSPNQMLKFGRKTIFHTFSNFLFTNHLTIQR
jgi:hypothetical protein